MLFKIYCQGRFRGRVLSQFHLFSKMTDQDKKWMKKKKTLTPARFNIRVEALTELVSQYLLLK